MLVGYARVSTLGQTIDLQVDALRAAGCEKIFRDIGVSGSKASRPGLDKALEHVRPGDVLVVWRLDRVGRSTTNVLALVEQLEHDRVGFRSLTEAFDTSGAMGRLLLTLIAGFAQMEKELTIERTHAGLAAARARGRVGGRKRSLTPMQDRAIRVIYDARDTPVAHIAAAFKVSQPTVWRSISRTRPAEPVAAD